MSKETNIHSLGIWNVERAYDISFTQALSNASSNNITATLNMQKLAFRLTETIRKADQKREHHKRRIAKRFIHLLQQRFAQKHNGLAIPT